MLCIYHIADHDGKGSGAVVKSVYPEIKLLGLNHDMEIPYDEIERHEMVVVCDFALPVDYMFELSKRKDFTWIDHHASVIEEYEKALKAGAERLCGIGGENLVERLGEQIAERDGTVGVKAAGDNRAVAEDGDLVAQGAAATGSAAVGRGGIRPVEPFAVVQKCPVAKAPTPGVFDPFTGIGGMEV